METKYYTGIGSRETPPEFLTLMVSIGKYLAQRGWTLRSGGADGADKAFEQGCDEAGGSKEIYLPWKDFNGNKSDLYLKSPKLSPVKSKAFDLASKYHPVWDSLNYGARCLMARNGMQILGSDLETPTSFVVCYNLGGFKHGGTSQALRIALDRKIHIFRLTEDNELSDIRIHMNRGLDFLDPLCYDLGLEK